MTQQLGSTPSSRPSIADPLRTSLDDSQISRFIADTVEIALPDYTNKSASLERIIQGHGAAPGVEIFNYDYELHEVTDSFGSQYTLISWAVQNDPNALPIGFSLSALDSSTGKVQSVRQFEVVPCFSEVEERCHSDSLLSAIHMLMSPQKFEQGLQKLKVMEQAQVISAKIIEPTIEEPQFSLVNTKAELVEWLLSKNVPIETWGKGDAKKIDDLVDEIVSGEGSISCIDGEVYLDNRVALGWIESPDGKYRLFEKSQRFLDGRDAEPRRRTNLGSLIAEKYNPEDRLVEKTQLRLLREELDIHTEYQVDSLPSTTRIEPSQCFPGIFKRNTYFPFKVRLDEKDYKPEYKEITYDEVTKAPKKETTISWIEI